MGNGVRHDIVIMSDPVTFLLAQKSVGFGKRMPFLPGCRLSARDTRGCVPAPRELASRRQTVLCCGRSRARQDTSRAPRRPQMARRRVGCPYRFSRLAPGYTPLRHCENLHGPTPSANYRPSLRSALPAAVESCSTALGDELF